jgi:hypothetical protein
MSRNIYALVVAIFTLGLAAVVLFYFMFLRLDTALVGTWKGTDEFGHEHYYEFFEDGTLTWWDRDRSHDGTFTLRGPFKGYYKKESTNIFIAKSYPILAPPLGRITKLGPDKIKQDDTGVFSRHNLVFQRVPKELDVGR